MPKGHPQKLIIDGYNVIYTDDRLRKIACRDLDSARKAFLDALSAYLKSKSMQVTVVFDGRGALADAEALIPGTLQVVYSARGQTADEVIVATLKQSRSPQSYLVVSSDRTHIVSVARGLGCQVLGSRRFLERLARAGSEAQQRDEEAETPPVDTDFWLEEFGKRGD